MKYPLRGCEMMASPSWKEAILPKGLSQIPKGFISPPPGTCPAGACLFSPSNPHSKHFLVRMLPFLFLFCYNTYWGWYAQSPFCTEKAASLEKDPAIRSFYLIRDPAVFSARHRHAAGGQHLSGGRRFLHFQLYRSFCLRGGKPGFPGPCSIGRHPMCSRAASG